MNEGSRDNLLDRLFLRRPLLIVIVLVGAQMGILALASPTRSQAALTAAGLGVVLILLGLLIARMRREHLRLEERIEQRTADLERANAILRGEVDMRRSVESSLRFEATHDSLTGLQNRQSIQCVIKEWLLDKSPFALLFIDVDDFKIINDTLGHDAGDAMLNHIASMLQDLTNDRALDARAGRLGGDEFILVARPCDTRAALALADQLQESLSEPLEIGDRKISVTLSIGVCATDSGRAGAETMLQHADLAMYRAKQNGKASSAAFDPRMQQDLTRRVLIENTLADPDALKDGLSAVFQPILNLRQGGVHAVEALARWRIEGLGDVSPAEFVPIADQIRRTPELDARILEVSCEAWRAWGEPELQLHVNLSHRSLARDDFADRALGILETSEVPCERIVFEIRERSFFDEESRTKVLENIQALREQGIRIGLDDFGTGYSSLSVLHELPIDLLKIDQKYLTNLDGRRDYIAVIEAIIRLARNLDLAIVAEGVNSAENLASMLDLECDFVQGFYFCKGAAADDIPRIIDRLASLTGRDAA